MSELQRISPYIRTAMDSTIRVDCTVHPRVIFDYELVYFTGGRGKIVIEGRAYPIGNHEVFLLKPNVEHAIYPAKNAFLHQPHIHFDLKYQEDSPATGISFKRKERMTKEELAHFRPDLLSSPPYQLPEKLFVHNLMQFEALFFDVIEEYQMKHSFYEISLKAKLLQLLVFLWKEQEQHTLPYSPSVQNELERVRDYIRCSAQHKLTLDSLAKEFNLSKFYLSKMFKARYHVSPIRYHRTVQMEKIREEILCTNTSLTHIAKKYGYENVNVFSRAFHSFEGVSPSSLRKRKASDEP